MHLREAKEKNKVVEFIAEKAKTHPQASRRHFEGVLGLMVGQKSKPTRKTSRRGSSGG